MTNSVIASAWNELSVEELMQKPVPMASSSRIDDAIAQLQSDKSHCVLILDEHQKLLGVFREEDVLDKVIGKSLTGEEPVGEFVDNEECFALKTNSSVTEVMDMMGQRGLRYIPLLDEQGYPKGIFSIREMIYYLAKQTENNKGRFSLKPGCEDAFGSSSSAIVEVLNLPISFALSRYGFNQVVRMGCEEPIGRAIKLFEGSHQLAGLLFDQGHLAGLFRVRDIPFKVLKNSNLKDQHVSKFMVPLPETVGESETIGNGIARMARNEMLFLHYKISNQQFGLITGTGLMSYLYDHIHDDF